MADLTPMGAGFVGPEGFRALGNTFSQADQMLLLERFTNRYTGDHKPAWAEVPMLDGMTWPLQFASDADWLANTHFAVSMGGRLDRRIKRCWEHPTWPGDPTAYGRLIRDLPETVQAYFGVNLRQPGWANYYNKWLRQYHADEEARQAAENDRSMTPEEQAAYDLLTGKKP